jgi:hypothetical protein
VRLPWLAWTSESVSIDFSGLVWFGVAVAALPFVGLGILIGWAIWG